MGEFVMYTLTDYKRICFLDNSITAAGYWIDDIFNAYRTLFPHSHISFMNCGISGGTSGAALTYLEDDLLHWNPDHVIIMFGMNDVNRNLYTEKPIDSLSPSQSEAIDQYEKNLPYKNHSHEI